MLGLLQNVAVLGILGLGMAIVVIGRGIDISMVAVLAVPAGLVLQMVQDGHSLPVALLPRVAADAGLRPVNGWLIAYAEVPSLFATLASGLFLAGLGQAALFRLDIVQWSPRLDGFERLGRGTARRPDADHHVRARVRWWSPSSCAGRGSAFYLRDRRQPLRRAHHRYPDAADDRPAIRAGRADRPARRPGAGRLGQQRARRASTTRR